MRFLTPRFSRKGTRLISTLERQSTSLFQAVNRKTRLDQLQWREASEKKGVGIFFSRRGSACQAFYVPSTSFWTSVSLESASIPNGVVWNFDLPSSTTVSSIPLSRRRVMYFSAATKLMFDRYTISVFDTRFTATARISRMISSESLGFGLIHALKDSYSPGVGDLVLSNIFRQMGRIFPLFTVRCRAVAVRPRTPSSQSSTTT